MDLYGFDWDRTPEPKPLTAVLAHPGHGRLVERIIMMVSPRLCFRGCWYALSWRDNDVAFYQPVSVNPGAFRK
jgi:hypothetical protein